MIQNTRRHWLFLAVAALIFGCQSPVPQSDITIAQGSVKPGTEVSFKGNSLKLLGSPISVGQTLPSTKLIDAATLKEVDISAMKGSVLFLSVVPSVDTKVCEAQTHILGEQGDTLPKEVKRITISRDLPFAQSRFASEADLTDIDYLSDYKEGAFGRSTGLFMDDLMLLARAVIIVDKEGIVQHIQVVPEIANLPDMETAFQKAKQIS